MNVLKNSTVHLGNPLAVQHTPNGFFMNMTNNGTLTLGEGLVYSCVAAHFRSLITKGEMKYADGSPAAFGEFLKDQFKYFHINVK